jgi:adenosylcobinamide-GDP ribazoletransferase
VVKLDRLRMTNTTDSSSQTRSGFSAASFIHAWRRDLLLAIGFFTRLPVGRFIQPAPPNPGVNPGPIPAGPAAEAAIAESAAATAPQLELAQAARAFPLVGLIVGIIGGLAYLFAVRIGLSIPLAALLAVAATAAVTGALHEDGWADFADGLGARGDRRRKLAAMKDSHIGSFGVLALLFATAIKVAALISLGAPDRVMAALIAAHALSRAVLPLAMRSLPLATTTGLAVTAGKPKAESVFWSLVLGFAAAFFAEFLTAIALIVVAVVAAWLVGRIAEREFGGYTGDVLGAIEQIAEVAVLLNLVSLR